MSLNVPVVFGRPTYPERADLAKRATFAEFSAAGSTLAVLCTAGLAGESVRRMSSAVGAPSVELPGC